MPERPRGQRGLLRPAHLRCRHHLHRFGDLQSIADGLDPPAYVAWALHNQNSEVPEPARSLRDRKSKFVWVKDGVWISDGTGNGAFISTSL
jgi:hypothetical protein